MASQITCLAKLGLLKVSHVVGTAQNGNAYEFYSLERSYRDEKANEWKNERVILRPVELCAVADLLKKAGNAVMTQQARIENARFQQQEGPVATAPATESISDDVPF
ncbi:MAG: hypothetical protein J6Y25_04660 [Elusimicrobiaceae bacterium]|nr:hypothetical protein [Elusimicrobiaceae bacterium]